MFESAVCQTVLSLCFFTEGARGKQEAPPAKLQLKAFPRAGPEISRVQPHQRGRGKLPPVRLSARGPPPPARDALGCAGLSGATACRSTDASLCPGPCPGNSAPRGGGARSSEPSRGARGGHTEQTPLRHARRPQRRQAAQGWERLRPAPPAAERDRSDSVVTLKKT